MHKTIFGSLNFWSFARSFMCISLKCYRHFCSWTVTDIFWKKLRILNFFFAPALLCISRSQEILDMCTIFPPWKHHFSLNGRSVFEPCFLKLLTDLTFFRLYCFTYGSYVVARSVSPSSMLDLLVALFVLLNWQQFNVPYRYKKEGKIWAKWYTAWRDRRLCC